MKLINYFLIIPTTKISTRDLPFQIDSMKKMKLCHILHTMGMTAEWSIDGFAKHEIYNKLHEMGVDITTYKIKNLSDKEAATLIIVEFSGTLKSWWDNNLTNENREKVVNATPIIPIIKTEPGGKL